MLVHNVASYVQVRTSMRAFNLVRQSFFDDRFEGPACNIDVNECVRGTAGCAGNAGCINSVGGYTCRCYWGFDGAPSFT